MNKFLIPLSFLLTSHAASTHAADYFIMDFEDGQKPAVSQGSPIWSLPPVFDNNYGPGNFFKVTDSTAHTGTYSLRFTYEARNNFCNTCGLRKLVHKSGLDGVNYFVVDPSHKDNDNITDLTDMENPATKKIGDGPGAKVGRVVYNKDNGYSRWEITSIGNDSLTNDKLSVKLLNPGINGESPQFNGGDEVSIARQCGVDGHIGGKINRRSDCDNVITWFGKVDNKQKPGDSIFRRMYIKAEVTSPELHQKLHFFRPDNKGPFSGNTVLVANSKNAIELKPEVTNLNGEIGGQGIYVPGENGFAADIIFKRGVWHYVEEEYKAATLNPNYDPNIDPQANPNDPNIHRYNTDGAYRLWFADSGSETTTPQLEEPNIRLPPLNPNNDTGGTHISFWGNVQHNLHSRGSWYLDDIKISDKKVGFAGTGGSANISSPNSPVVAAN